MMVKECQQTDHSSSGLGLLVAEVKRLRHEFLECSFHHTYKVNIVPSHKLARQVENIAKWPSSLDVISKTVWLDTL